MDELKPMTGLMNGLLFSAVFWLAAIDMVLWRTF
ncbi:hypothetical protein SAMN05216566_101345 [Aureimonas phyllosphaerae]|uniref:Uncharacterized protein n=1 Tax=Aureimonas phyllosphaerae TaxID=1166078 RepID=A0A7W6FTW7_9HYPH|nr:hypothetical protein [Aureimonas phyllosphaerae]MBB3958372.1 hypothetical protein [Aureimonas phyllosphaerae]SFE96035.1 hypothetical protein SAMN05216566_101345 [Aureimonas phyllosphaerae]